jgi:hypothetical protein
VVSSLQPFRVLLHVPNESPLNIQHSGVEVVFVLVLKPEQYESAKQPNEPNASILCVTIKWFMSTGERGRRTKGMSRCVTYINICQRLYHNNCFGTD